MLSQTMRSLSRRGYGMTLTLWDLFNWLGEFHIPSSASLVSDCLLNPELLLPVCRSLCPAPSLPYLIEINFKEGFLQLSIFCLLKPVLDLLVVFSQRGTTKYGGGRTFLL